MEGADETAACTTRRENTTECLAWSALESECPLAVLRPMANVAFVVHGPGPGKTRVLAELRKLTQTSFGELVRRTAERLPVVEGGLFPRERPAFAAELLEIYKSLLALGADARLYMLEGTYRPDRAGQYLVVTPDVVQNMIREHEKELRRQRRLGFRESGEE